MSSSREDEKVKLLDDQDQPEGYGALPNKDGRMTVRSSSEEESSSDNDSYKVDLERGAVIEGEWRVVERLGEGGCGTVYHVRSSNGLQAALKVEHLRSDKQDEILRMEVYVLKRLAKKEHFCDLFSYGKTSVYNYMVVTLVGRTLQQLRRACPEQRFSTATTVRVGFQCLKAIETLHLFGFVHRDIKPANFAFGQRPADLRTVFLIDFGLARQIKALSRTGLMLREPRNNVPFRGTMRYCSPNVHRHLEQGRHDDLWSLFYVLVECIRGSLPWRGQEHNKQQVKHSKSHTSDRALLEKCPTEFFQISKYLQSLVYFTTPDYDLISKKLDSVMKRKAYKWQAPFDWEPGGRHFHCFTDMSSCYSVNSIDRLPPISQPQQSATTNVTTTNETTTKNTTTMSEQNVLVRSQSQITLY